MFECEGPICIRHEDDEAQWGELGFQQGIGSETLFQDDRRDEPRLHHWLSTLYSVVCLEPAHELQEDVPGEGEEYAC